MIPLMTSAIIVAAGSSRRMGFDKLAATLAGRPVLEHAVRALAVCGEFGEIILVTNPGRWPEAQAWADAVARETGVPVRLAEGGAERHDSVAAGLAALDAAAEFVAVHDGARPLVLAADLRRVVAEARRSGAASLAHPVVETVKRADAAGGVTASVDRDGLWAMETPQVFAVALLREACAAARARGEKLTDEVSAVQAVGHPVQLVASTALNVKITHPQDLALAETLMITRRSLLLAAAGFFGAAPSLRAEGEPVAGRIVRARAFLAGLIDAELDLLPEFRGSPTYWLYHDNYLAAAVLKSSHPELSARITAAIRGCGVTESGKIEIVLGEAKAPLPFRRYELIEVRREGAKVIKTEIVKPEVFPGWEPYADLRLLAAMAETDAAKAAAHFAAARAMWDGRGFADAVVPVAQRYATYKLALALIAARRRGFDFPEAEAVRTLMLARQHADGGFITDYTAEGKNVGFANVETTSLCVLALA
jgi:2-C-methyl-D-erythritol 4-phosphate cytidylyltransferase